MNDTQLGKEKFIGWKQAKKLLLLLCFISLHAMSFEIDDWESTQYIYLAKPIYIYKTESNSEVLGGKLGNSLKDVVEKIKKRSKSKNTVYYYFEIQEVLFGKSEEYISLELEYEGEYKECNMNNSFQNHDNSDFWKTELGRSNILIKKPINLNCFGEPIDNRQVDTCFEMDKLYLLIDNDQLKAKQYELIESENDQWLQFVREKVKELTSISTN